MFSFYALEANIVFALLSLVYHCYG